MGTKFDDFGASVIKNAPEISLHSQAGPEDEANLIEDGNAHVLINFENQRKRGDYARSQTSRTKKELSLNMNTVDWSGFPGAAHHKTPLAGKGGEPRRSNSQKERNMPAVLESTASLDRRKQMKGASRSMSPRRSPNIRHRSRRNFFGKGETTSSTPGNEDEDGEKKSKNLNMASTRRLAERRSSGSQRSSRRASTRVGATSKSRSKSRTRRQQTVAQRRSVSPTAAVEMRDHQSLSPSGRRRRPVAAAASSTTLEVSNDSQRRRSSSIRGRRKSTKEKKAAGESESKKFHAGTSFKW